MKNFESDDERATNATVRRRRPAEPSEVQAPADEAEAARTAMAGTLRAMGDDLARLADPRVAAKEHPWLLIGSAVAAGIAAGALLNLASPRPAVGKSPEKSSESARDAVASPQRPAPSWWHVTLETLATGMLSTLVQASLAAVFFAEKSSGLKSDSSPTGAPHAPARDGAARSEADPS